MSLIIIYYPGHNVQKWQSWIELSLTFGGYHDKSMVWQADSTYCKCVPSHSGS